MKNYVTDIPNQESTLDSASERHCAFDCQYTKLVNGDTSSARNTHLSPRGMNAIPLQFLSFEKKQ